LDGFFSFLNAYFGVCHPPGAVFLVKAEIKSSI